MIESINVVSSLELLKWNFFVEKYGARNIFYRLLKNNENFRSLAFFSNNIISAQKVVVKLAGSLVHYDVTCMLSRGSDA